VLEKGGEFAGLGCDGAWAWFLRAWGDWHWDARGEFGRFEEARERVAHLPERAGGEARLPAEEKRFYVVRVDLAECQVSG
jgi:hypothetical protein